MSAPAAPIAVLPTAAKSDGRLRLWGVLRNRSILIGGVVILVVVFLALFAPYLAPFSPEQIGVGRRLSLPSAAHWLGTDEFGRDVFSRILFGARLTLYIGVVAVGIGFACTITWPGRRVVAA